MKLWSWIFVSTTAILAGGLAYLWLFETVPAKKALLDLEEENKRLLGLASKASPETSHPSLQPSETPILIPTDRLFRPGTDELTDEGKGILDELISELPKDYSEIIVACHTDSTPVKTNRDKYPTNWELGAHRATAVVRYLIARGIPPNRLVAVSYGDARPLASNATKEGQAQNRRIEITVR